MSGSSLPEGKGTREFNLTLKAVRVNTTSEIFSRSKMSQRLKNQGRSRDIKLGEAARFTRSAQRVFYGNTKGGMILVAKVQGALFLQHHRHCIISSHDSLNRPMNWILSHTIKIRKLAERDERVCSVMHSSMGRPGACNAKVYPVIPDIYRKVRKE